MQSNFMLLMFLSLVIRLSQSEECPSGHHYVQPNNSSSCNAYPNCSCHVLEDYANNTTFYFGNDTEIYLLFLEGNHTSATTLNIISPNATKLLLQAVNGTVTIQSDFDINVRELALQDISINGGDVMIVAADVCIKGCNFENSYTTLSRVQNLTLESTNFSSYGRRNENSTTLTISTKDGSDLWITQCKFMEYSESKDCKRDINSPLKDSLITILITGGLVTLVDSRIEGSKCIGLRAELNASSLKLSNCHVTNNRMSGIHIVTSRDKNNIILENTAITSNSLEDVSSGNPYRWDVPNAAGLSVNPRSDSDISQMTYMIRMNEMNFQDNIDKNDVPKTVFIYISHNASVSHSNFTQNTGSAIAVYLTKLFTISGNTQFIGNYAYEGGAMLMFSTHLTISDKSYITLQDNTVENVGGAICIRDIPIQIDKGQPCFYQLTSKDPSIKLTFINNRARKGGVDIYGATTRTSCNEYYHTNALEPNSHHQQIMQFNSTSTSTVSSDPTRICLCDENDNFKCTDLYSIFHNTTAYPGENITISAVIVGADFGAVAGSVFAVHDENSSLGNFESSQNINDIKCQRLHYTIHAEEGKEVNLILSSHGLTPNKWYDKIEITEDYIDQYEKNELIDINLLSTPIYINVTMKNCPAGFYFNNTYNACKCDHNIEKYVTDCHIVDGSVFIDRNKYLWIAQVNNSDSNAIRFNTQCPAYKCTSNVTLFDISTPNTQCRGNRIGTICGKCIENYSLALGSSRCMKCDNKYLFLIPVFMAAGIFLVFFIKILDLTVANGSINGFIFYSNIVWMNKHMLLSLDNRCPVLQVFLAWFNLDFGIETCFFNGLDAYAFTYLQFIFPIYIWCISIALIYIAQRFNILGNNGVPVLATLLLLSYSKIFNIITSIMTVTYVTEIGISSNSSNISLVWGVDGNITYFNILRIPLLIIATLLLIFVCIPYMVALLFPRYLNRIPFSTIRRRVNQFKPIFDAYSGPFKDRMEYWVGVQLFVRAFLLIILSITQETFIEINSILLLVLMSALLLYKAHTGPLYKSIYLSIMENSLIFNIIALTATLFISEEQESRIWLSYSLIAIALLQFIILVIMKIILKIKRKFCGSPPSDTSTEHTPIHNTRSNYRLITDNRTAATDSGWVHERGPLDTSIP